jgi:hypothetical protein
VTSVRAEGWMLRIRNCLRAAKGLSAVMVPFVFLPLAMMAVYSYLGIAIPESQRSRGSVLRA